MIKENILTVAKERLTSEVFSALKIKDKNIFCKEYLNLKLEFTISGNDDIIYTIEFTYLENNLGVAVYFNNNFFDDINEKFIDPNEMEDALKIFIEYVNTIFVELKPIMKIC